MTLTSYIGDTKTFSIPLRWGNREFDASAGWGLTFTVKQTPLTQTDAQALLQKSLGAGIELNGKFASVTVDRVDTYRLADELEEGSEAFQADPGTYFWDIQATGVGDNAGKTRTVASGTFVLLRDITRGGASSVPIYTTEPPFLGVGDVIDGGEPDTDYGTNFEIDGGAP